MKTTQPLFSETKEPSAPVECLGQTFPNDEARREYFLGLLREKLADPAFRKIEGFPIGSDEDILALSDPPYFTACPNPFVADFIIDNSRKFSNSSYVYIRSSRCYLIEIAIGCASSFIYAAVRARGGKV